MESISELFANRALVAALVAWFTAQLIKIIINFAQEKRFDFRLIMSSGGMPSSHSSTVCALCTMIWRMCSPSSVEFAISTVFAFVVMYDAAGVRRAAGEQARVLNKIAEDLANRETKYMEKDLKELIGHTPFQVLIGALLGVVIGAVFPL